MSDLPSNRVPPSHPEVSHGPTGSAEGSLARIWGRIRRPVDTPAAIEALVGISARNARQLVSATVAGSPEAGALLAAMPKLIRNLSISTVAVPERSVGEIRGPVLWSETLTARSSAAGDPGVFVCATLSRAYDTPENRILTAALALIVRGGQDVERLHRRDRAEPPLFTAARRNGDLALRFLDHRSLLGVRRDKVDRRVLNRLAHDPRRRSYRPVVDTIQLANEPIDVATIRVFCEPATTAEHDLLIGVADQLARRGVRIPPFLVAGHALEAGPLRYCHRAHPSSDRPAGVSIGRIRLVIPTAEGSSPDDVVVAGRGDLIAAVDDAIRREAL